MRDEHTLIHLDSRRSGVQVPPDLAKNPALTLKLSYQFQGKTTLNEEAITTFLKFDGNYTECILPWSAIWGMTGSKGKNAVWPEDMPKELLVQLAKEQLRMLGKRIFGKKGAEEATPTTASTTTESDPTTKAGKNASHLRRIK